MTDYTPMYEGIGWRRWENGFEVMLELQTPKATFGWHYIYGVSKYAAFTEFMQYEEAARVTAENIAREESAKLGVEVQAKLLDWTTFAARYVRAPEATLVEPTP